MRRRRRRSRKRRTSTRGWMWLDVACNNGRDQAGNLSEAEAWRLRRNYAKTRVRNPTRRTVGRTKLSFLSCTKHHGLIPAQQRQSSSLPVGPRLSAATPGLTSPRPAPNSAMSDGPYSSRGVISHEIRRCLHWSRCLWPSTWLP